MAVGSVRAARAMYSMVGVLASFCLVLPSLIGNALGKQEYTVGGTNFWTVPSDPNFYERWAAQYTFYVGDSLDFQYYDSSSVVVQVNKEDFEACTTDHARLTGNTFETLLDLTSPGGTLWIVDSDPTKCQAGLKVSLESLDQGGTPSTPTTPGSTGPPAQILPKSPQGSGAVNLMASKGAVLATVLPLLAIIATVMLV